MTVSLNLSDSQIELAGHLLTELLREYEKTATTGPVMPSIDRAVLTELLERPFPCEGVGVEQLFADIRERILPQSTHIAHPRYLAYVLGPSNGIAPFADAIASALNQNCNFWQLSPAASVVERSVVSWLCSLFGYPASAGGLMTSGGSMANLTALSAALCDRHPGDFRRVGLQSLTAPLVIYTSDQAHRCIEKDAVILGLGLDHVRKIPVNESFRMRLDILAAEVEADRAAGRLPFCVVATAGTVNTGAVDPLDDLAEFCAGEGLWLHVDGAFGALFVLSQRRRADLLPCGRADSIALDPHKLLFAPLEAGCLIVRDREKLSRAFSFSSSYLTADQDPLLVNYMDYGPQLSRSFKAFKVWCALHTFGVRAFEAAADHMLDIAQYLADRLGTDPRFDLMAPVSLNAVCFRLRRLDDSGNEAVLARLVGEGTALLGPVRIDGRLGLRACVTNYRTQREDIDLIVGRLVELAATS